MFHPNFFNSPDLAPYGEAMMNPRGPRRRFDEYYRCYPVAMLPGPERDNVNHGGKVIMPPSALDKLTRLHITYPMLFELINGVKERMTHAGVLEFIAEEGKIYLPYWIMQTLLLEPGDLLQIKSTDLPPGTFIKLQPQSIAFLEISDPKAVLENAMRNFSCLTRGDVFSFSYNDSIYSIEVLETKPGGEGTKSAISVLETDLEVDFAPPLGYVEPSRSASGTSTPRSIGGAVPGLRGESGTLHNTGTMAQAINYSSIAPSATTAAQGSRAVSSNFLNAGQRLASKKGAKPLTPKASTPVAGASTNKTEEPAKLRRKTNGPQPLRLPPGKLFFGYEIKPVKAKSGDAGQEEQKKENRFAGQGMSLRPGGVKRKGDGGTDMDVDKAPPPAPGGERKGGRTLRDAT